MSKTLLDLWMRNSKKEGRSSASPSPKPAKVVVVGERESDLPTTSEFTDVIQTTDMSKNISTTQQTVSVSCIVPILTNRNEPSSNYKFPKVGKERTCRAEWFKNFPWLHYDEERDCVLCFQCIKAYHVNGSRLLHKGEIAFLSAGFRNWKKGPERFRMHEKSSHHYQSVQLISQRMSGIPVTTLLYDQNRKQQEAARRSLITIVSSIRYLACTGQALRGRYCVDGNLLTLLNERTMDVPELQSWLRRHDNWLSGDCQNELVKIMAHSLQRGLINDIKLSPFYSIIADGTTDISGQEELSLCIRCVAPEGMKIRELFLGMFNPPDSTAKTIVSSVKDMLLRLSLNLSNLRGQCFDGAANMSGRVSGVQTLIRTEQPKALYVHCSNHSLDLALQEVARSCDTLCDVLSLVKDVCNIILDSAKRKGMYANVVLPPCSDANECSKITKNLLPLCPTRWAVRTKSMFRFFQNYERVKITIQTILDERTVNDDRRCTLKGYLKKLEKYETMFFLIVGINIFGPCEQLANSLQSPNFSAAGVKVAVEVLKNTLSSFRTEEKFEEIYGETMKQAERLNLKLPTASRSRKTPRRLEQTDDPTEAAVFSLETKLRKEYYEIIDRLENELHRRFEQEGFNALIKLENILIHAAKGRRLSVETIKEELGVHGSDFDIEKLQAQCIMLPSVLCVSPTMTVTDIAKQISESPVAIHVLLDQVVLLATLILTIPASAASCERSFSALRCLKTYLRTTMTQKRLTHLLLLHSHNDRTKMLDLNEIAKEFIAASSERKAVFGCF